MTALEPASASELGRGLSHTDYRTLRRFRGLDGLRAICIVTVILQHSANPWLARWSGGFNGVVLFFVISGFLITSLLLREESRYGRVSRAGFFTRRAFRILPLYYAILALYAILVLALGFDDRPEEFRSALPYYVLFFQEHVFISPHPSGVPFYPFEVSWSLGFEEKFYLLLPFILFGLAGLRGRAAALTLLAVPCALAPLVAGHVGYYLFWYFPMLVGSITAVLLHSRRGYARLQTLREKRSLYWIAVTAALCYEATQLQDLGGPWLRVVLYIGLILVFALLISSVVSSGENRVLEILDSRAFVLVGSISYAMYLTHLIVLNAVERVVPAPASYGAVVSMPATIVLTVAICIPLQRYFEGPITELGRRISRRKFTPTPA